MKYTCWVLEVMDATTQPSVVPFPGVEQERVPIYLYTLELDGGVGPDGVAGGMLTITSTKPLTWRAGQTILVDIEDVSAKVPTKEVTNG